ncbi:MAG: twin-arginine translocase subunit TatC [Chloroflexota bacterium]|nr:twin-arginine translocase subunit TatC [Chloroflexota bacterium]
MSHEEATMSLLEHLEELRRRLIIIVATVLVAAIVGFIFAQRIIDLLIERLPAGYEKLYFTGVADAFGVLIKVALFAGIAIAMPVILYQVWRFVTPGLTTRERRVVWPLLLGALGLFALGVVVGYVIIPFALNFLLSFAEPGKIEPLLTINEYIGFVTTMMLAFGLVLEFPIVLIALARVGILSYRRIAAQRRFIILGITIFAIVVTPGGDPFSPTILGVVMYVLFEVSLLIIRLIRR